MKLKKMAIINYRQFQNAVINFDEELTILAGANNSGKTSIIELFKRIFKDKKFSKEDISAEYFSKLQHDFICSIDKIYNITANETEFRENIKKEFSIENKNKWTAIKIKIEVQYDKSESISLFSDYLMELNDTCTGFFFLFNYEINIAELNKCLGLNATNLFDKKHEIQELKSNRKTKETSVKLTELKVEYEEFLIEIFSEALENRVYFADINYENIEPIGIREFQSLFNYNYLNATRLLNDEKTDNYFSISKELLSHFKRSRDWEEFKKQIIKDIKGGLRKQKLNEKVKEHSLIKAQNALENIEKYFEYNKGEFSLQTDISDELLLDFLSSSLQTFFEFENGTKLKEFSQGLGISNLIYMCLKVEAFVQQYQSDVVDIFVIEEPEAHMHPQMERMLIEFINEILLNEDNNRVQGMITTHSSEIIKCSDLRNIRVIRIDKLLKSSVYDMNLFKQNLDTEEERQFFSFLFSINYSDLIFANKVIMYEGDTEKLYIEKLLSTKEFEGLSNQYISFVQVGGAYAHWYRKLVHFLKIRTLIITDIDYCKKLTSINEIKYDDGITNAGLIQYYKDYVTLSILKRDILSYCEHKCRQHRKDCLYEKAEIEKISLIQEDLRKRPCPKIKKPDYSIIKVKPTVTDIDLWIKDTDDEMIKVVSQGERDAYTRTLEEAMLCKLLGITVESINSVDWWKKQILNNKIKLYIPTRKKNITVRDILNENKNNKTDFMYSIILSELHLKALPNYIREGLMWLM
ncbi:AAA family ATPase [Eubacterium barkeri]|uniref:Predicted ATP-dependent endonuclease of the OLD family, contains P-loop ATPase and TOPRIM domains n=1 Tax=Eubacterium barkeri TaxID=1528 RepID=A0A1H3CXJ5_EUBBA|nr:AAA family ATPase [Eubacterium barkeri]SDX58847.1 Predicted ATP-dependent endonuclease of the OLD family, contains P-loop ATPase and TOPRIM domains [Eubacterium barkeri]